MAVLVSDRRPTSILFPLALVLLSDCLYHQLIQVLGFFENLYVRLVCLITLYDFEIFVSDKIGWLQKKALLPGHRYYCDKFIVMFKTRIIFQMPECVKKHCVAFAPVVNYRQRIATPAGGHPRLYPTGTQLNDSAK